MNILLISRSLTHGGAERVCCSWANGLTELGCKVFILTDLSFPVTYRPDDKVTIIPTVVKLGDVPDAYQKKSVLKKIYYSVAQVKQIREIIDQHQIDVSVNLLYHLNVSTLIAAKLSHRKCKTIITDHNSCERPESAPMNFSAKLNKFYINPLFDHMTVLTEADHKIMLKRGIRNCSVLYNPLFLKPVDNVTPREKVVLSVGRIDAWHYKGFDVLIKAWRQIYKDCKGWKLRIIGWGEDSQKKMLMQLAGESVSSIDFSPYTPNIKDEYLKASIYALSSRYEGWGLVAVEAMSQGCAVIACNYKGRQAEFIDEGFNGFLSAPEDVDALATKIKLLINDEAMREKVSQNGITSVERFSEINIAKSLLAIISKTFS